MRNVVCLVNMAATLVGFPGGSILKVDLVGVVKNKRATSGFGFQVILGGSISVSGHCTLQLSSVNLYKLA